MTLYRATYQRKGKPCGVTFVAATNAEADDFVSFWERMSGVVAERVVALRPAYIQQKLELR